MADLIKKIKIKKQDGTFTDYIPIGAEAQNISTSDGDSVQLKLNKKPYYYNTVADMKADTKLKVGDMAITLGYYEPNDGGGAEYKIINNNELINDEGSIITLNNKLKAMLISKSKINIMQFGIKRNTDITLKIQLLLNYISMNTFITELEFNNETYEMNDSTSTHLENHKYFKINFNGCQINYTGTTNNEGALFRLFFKDDKNAICELENGSFDCSSIQPDFSEDNIDPISLKSVLHVVYAKILNVKNCHFSNLFFSRCINSNGVEIAHIENCTGINCGGRSATGSKDSHGDALYFQRIGVKLIYDNNGYIKYLDDNNNIYWYDNINKILYNEDYIKSNVSLSTLSQDLSSSKPAYIYINNCDFASYKAVEDMHAETDALNGCKSGRCGVVFGEFSLTNTDKFLYITNSSFYNYQRSIHIENVKNVNVSIDNSKFLEYGTCILGSGMIAGTNNFNITNCIFDKTIKIRAMHDNYDYIFTGGNNNNIKNFTFDNCEFRNLAGRILIYGKNIPLVIKNSNVEVEDLFFSTNVYVIFEKCNIKSNKQSGYRTIYNFNECDIELGYKHDENSSYNYLPNTQNDLYFDTTKYGYITKCYIKNMGYQFRNNVIFKLNHFIYDENFPGNSSDASKKYCILINSISNIYFEDNIVENNNNLIYYLFNESSISDHVVNLINNTIYNLRFSLWNATKYKSQIINNRMINSNENIINAFSLYNSKIIVNNNYIYGYTTPIVSYTNALQYNNYKIEDTQATLIS